MLKKLFIAAAAILMVSAAAFAQGSKNAAPGSKAEKFYQVVPEHEFLINGFGVVSTLLYNANIGYDWPKEDLSVPAYRQQKSDFVNFSNGPFHPTGLGGGGGFGYIWHFHPNVGLMTGIDVAYYSGGIRNICANVDEDYAFHTSYVDDENYLITYGTLDYSEMQKYLALQIPVMFQFMAPMGQGNHHFYAAVGARIGFGVWNQYKGFGKKVKVGYNNAFTYTDIWKDADDQYFPFYGGFYPGDRFNPDKPGFVEEGGNFRGPGNNGDYSWWHRESGEDYPFQPSGKWGAKLVNVMVSAEIGFRWRLTDGLGLYTGIYCDYGIPAVNKKQNVAQITGYERSGEANIANFEAHSIMNTQTTPGLRVKEEGEQTPTSGPKRKYMYEPLEPTVKAHTLGLGLKLKLAFGKVLPTAPPPPPVLPKPDTVVKTIIIRDTVQNTVVVRDTVTNTVVVRDTVTIIKEIPVEIQQTMRDLSNTLFEFNKFNLGEKARGYLDEIVDWLVANPKVNVEIGGHTDGIGSQEYNQKLSENRAKTVYNYFVEHGVNKDRLSYKGYGKSEPIADNSTDAGRQQNRRVELKIIND